MQSILAEAPPHSRVVLAGACHAPVEIGPLQFTTAEVTVTASFAYRPAEFRAAIGHLSERPHLFGQLITGEHALDETADAFDALATNPDQVKILINPADAS